MRCSSRLSRPDRSVGTPSRSRTARRPSSASTLSGSSATASLYRSCASWSRPAACSRRASLDQLLGAVLGLLAAHLFQPHGREQVGLAGAVARRRDGGDDRRLGGGAARASATVDFGGRGAGAGASTRSPAGAGAGASPALRPAAGAGAGGFDRHPAGGRRLQRAGRRSRLRPGGCGRFRGATGAGSGAGASAGAGASRAGGWAAASAAAVASQLALLGGAHGRPRAAPGGRLRPATSPAAVADSLRQLLLRAPPSAAGNAAGGPRTRRPCNPWLARPRSGPWPAASSFPCTPCGPAW